MFRLLASRPLPMRSRSSRKGAQKTPAVVGLCYVGLGDQFDDDRRLVRDQPKIPDEDPDNRIVSAAHVHVGS